MTCENADSESEANEEATGRRRILGGAAGILGTASLGSVMSSVAGATSTPSVEAGEVQRIDETHGREYYAVTLTRRESDEVVERYLGALGKRAGDVQIHPVDRRDYELAKSGGVSAVSTDVVAQGEGVVERSKEVSSKTGGCCVHNNYEHTFKGVSVEFEQRVNDIGITTAAAALVLVIESAGLGALVLGAGALLALVSTEDSVTTGFNEVDTVFCNITNYKQVIAVGYDVTNESAFMSPQDAVIPPGHPFR